MGIEIPKDETSDAPTKSYPLQNLTIGSVPTRFRLQNVGLDTITTDFGGDGVQHDVSCTTDSAVMAEHDHSTDDGHSIATTRSQEIILKKEWRMNNY